MNWQKLNPFSYFSKLRIKHKHHDNGTSVPVWRKDSTTSLALNNLFVQLHQELNRLFDSVGFPRFLSNQRSLLSPIDKSWSGLDQPAFNPHLQLVAEDDEYIVTLEAAGLDKKDVDIEIRDRHLVISGQKRHHQDCHYYRYGAFQRLLALPKDAEDYDISASKRKGILTVRIPRQSAQIRDRRRIAIETY